MRVRSFDIIVQFFLYNTKHCRLLLPVVSQTLPAVLDGVGDDGGVVELARHEDQLLADLPPPHLLVEAGRVAVGQRVPRVLRVQLRILQNLSLRRRQSLREKEAISKSISKSI